MSPARNGHGLWDPQYAALTSHVFGRGTVDAQGRATAVVAHLTAEAALLKTVVSINGRRPAGPPCGCVYVIDHLVPVFGTQIEVVEVRQRS